MEFIAEMNESGGATSVKMEEATCRRTATSTSLRLSMLPLNDPISTPPTEQIITLSKEDDVLIANCWAHQSCDACLADTEHHCSWCAASLTCVPNTATWPVLAPIWKSRICGPDTDDRWELRGNDFGCACSTRTALSVFVAVVATIALLALSYLVAQWTAHDGLEKLSKRLKTIWTRARASTTEAWNRRRAKIALGNGNDGQGSLDALLDRSRLS